MKKLFIATLLAVTVATSAFSAEIKVSNAIEKKFKVEFKDASNVSWSMASEYAKATFVLDDVRMEAFYTQDGDMIGASRAISIDELPVVAKRTFVKKYDGYTVKEAILFEGADETAYFISAENDQESVIVKVTDNSQISTFKRTKK